jgi:Zn-finger nucleic acid-binding protein
MKCIICDADMLLRYVKGVEIDYCTHCGGVWLDGGELEKLSGLDPSAGRTLACSNCHTLMSTKTVNKVEIDFCPGCGGVWLDRGELEKLSYHDPNTGQEVPMTEFIEREILRRLESR